MKKYRSVICTPVKNENPYIKEWIDYHLLLGVDHIYLYDDHSAVPIKETIGVNEKVTVIDWDRVVDWEVCTYKLSNQGAIYQHFYENYSNLSEWAAIIDADEFIVLKKHNDINEFLFDYSIHSEYKVGAIALNWVMYGSSGQYYKRSVPVLERFTARGYGVSEWIKCISRTEAVVSYDHAHFPILKSDYKQITPSRQIFPLQGSVGKHYERTTESDDSIACINHYSIKSIEELHEKKSKGRADQTGVIDIEEYRLQWDRNDYYDEYILNFIKRQKQPNIISSDIEALVEDLWTDHLNDYEPKQIRNIEVMPEWANRNIYALSEELIHISSSELVEENEHVSEYTNMLFIQTKDVALVDSLLNSCEKSYIFINHIYDDAIYNTVLRFLAESNSYSEEFKVKRYTDSPALDNWGRGVIILKKK